MTSSTPEALWSSRAIELLHPAAVVCERLRRRVARQALLDGVDLHVAVGARLLLVSTPDASASLLLRILAGLAHPDGGRFRLAGALVADASRAGWARRITYVGPEPGLFSWMSADDALALAARLIGLERLEAGRRIDQAVEHWGLTEGRERRLSRMGLAFMQRTAMATALLGDPEVVLLDEPLRALDPDERARLLRLPGDRRTVLLASRYPASEAELVNEVAFLRRGRLELNVPVTAFAEAGLPLSLRGVQRLAGLATGRGARREPAEGRGGKPASA